MTTEDQPFDDEMDVVVAGFGVAGAAAAIAAHDADPAAAVTILEKMPEGSAGGNSRASGQSLFCPDGVEATKTYLRHLGEPNPVSDDLLQVWAEELVAQEPWIESIAADVGMRYVRRQPSSNLVSEGKRKPNLAEHPDLPGAECFRYHSTIEPGPSGVWHALKANVDRRDIDVRYATGIVDVVQHPFTREIHGVVAQGPDGRRAIKARRGVVLCTGGFENNLQMQRDYAGYERIYTAGSPANTGDGLRILQRAGADLWHMRGFSQAGGIFPGIKTPDYDAAFLRNIAPSAHSWIEVAKDGRRFHNETLPYRSRHYKHRVHGNWRETPHAFVMPVHMIFDEAVRRSGPIAWDDHGWNIVVEGYRWSDDNSAEVACGWITRADNVVDLANKIGRAPQDLQKAISRYNEACRTGCDGEFNRSPETLAPIEIPPFYAVEIVPALILTSGGGRRTARGEVVSVDGEIIPRLYEAGELGMLGAHLYQSGLSLVEGMAFGRLAGRHAVEAAPWSA